MAENAKAGKNKIGDNQRNPRLTISSCLCALVAKSSLRSLRLIKIPKSVKSVANFLVDFCSKFGIIQIATEMADIAENRTS